MTPNWDDPAVHSGGNPTLASDRYSLALIFLRVVGAANFPIQARQRQDGCITVEFAMAPGPVASVLTDRDAPIWALCAAGLSTASPDARPPASAWVAALEELLDQVGAHAVLQSVWAAQGGGPSGPRLAGYVRPDDVRHPAFPGPASAGTSLDHGGRLHHRRHASLAPSHFRPELGGGLDCGPDRRRRARQPRPEPVAPGGDGLPPARVADGGRSFIARRSGRWSAPGNRADGIRSLAFCALIDILFALVGLFLVAMLVAPVLGI